MALCLFFLNGENYMETYLAASVSNSKAHGGFQGQSSIEKGNDRARNIMSEGSKLEDLRSILKTRSSWV